MLFNFIVGDIIEYEKGLWFVIIMGGLVYKKDGKLEVFIIREGFSDNG